MKIQQAQNCDALDDIKQFGATIKLRSFWYFNIVTKETVELTPTNPVTGVLPSCDLSVGHLHFMFEFTLNSFPFI